MKKILIGFILTVCTISINAQETSNTEIEKAVSTKNYLYKEEVFSLNNIPAFRIDAVKVTNIEKFNTTNGLRVIHWIRIGKELKSFYNYIDANEIDGLITALQYINTIVKSKTTPDNYTEIKYNSQSGFQLKLASVLNLQNKLDWSFIVQTNTANNNTVVTLTIDEIDKLSKTFQQAKSKFQ